MRSCSEAVVEPGKSRREFIQRFGNCVLLQVREIACVGLARRFGDWLSGEVLERVTVINAAEIAEATIKTTARIESMRSFFLFDEVVVVVDLVRGAVERREEPPGSEGPSLSKSMVRN